MTDTLTPTQRHDCMSRVHSKNTKPEILVRKWLWQHGFRYRLNVKDIPGRPDIVMRKYKTLIFVNGCFWHGHDGCDKFVMPKSNVEFWQSKISRNRERDLKNYKTLQESGWNVIVVWECGLKSSSFEETMAKVISKIGKDPQKPFEYPAPDSGFAVAAEPEAEYKTTTANAFKKNKN